MAPFSAFFSPSCFPKSRSPLSAMASRRGILPSSAMPLTRSSTVANSDKVGEIYNVGSGKPVSVNELIRLLGSPETVNIPKRPGEPDCTWADITKIRRELGWEPKSPNCGRRKSHV